MAELVARATMLIRRRRAEVFDTFAEERDGATRLSVEATGFRGERQLDQVVGATEGLSIVLCDLKTSLETGRSAHLVADKAELIRRAQAEAR